MEYRQNAADAGASPWVDRIAMLAAALLAQRRFPSRGRDGGAMTPGGLGGCARIQPCASMIEASQSLWMPTIVF